MDREVDTSKERLMLLLQVRGHCSKFEYKLIKFETFSIVQCPQYKSSLFRSMTVALHAMDSDVGEWMDEMGKMVEEWKELHR